MTDMTTGISGVGNHRIAAAQQTQRNGCVGGIAANRAHIGLLSAEEFDDLIVRHLLNHVNVARSLIVAIDLPILIWMSLGVATHEIRILHTAYRAAGRIFAGNQINGLRLSPRILLPDDTLYVTNIHRHFPSHFLPSLKHNNPAHQWCWWRRIIRLSVYQQTRVRDNRTLLAAC